MLTPIIYSNTGFKSAPNKVQSCNAGFSLKNMRGGGGPSRLSLINFSGTPDVFIKQVYNPVRYEELLASINAKITKQLNVFTPEKLDAAIKTVMQHLPDATEQEVLTVMQRLTQWANYRCLPKMARMLEKEKLTDISNSTQINNCFNYLYKTKRLFEFSPPRNDSNIVCFATKNELNQILERKHPANTIFINLEGFDDGVNLFSDDNKLAEQTINILQQVNFLRKQKPKNNFNHALYRALNGDIKDEMAKFAYPLKTLQIKAPATREVVLAQMAPYSLAKSDSIQNIIETLGHFYAKDDAKNYSKLITNIADYYDSRLTIHTKQSLIEYIDKIKVKIDNFLKEKNLPQKNLYYIIPDEYGINKSYGLITHMFARHHGIQPTKIHRIEDTLILNSYPPNSTFVILDDFSGSGDSLTRVLEYATSAYHVNPDKHILFCPLTAFEEGVQQINNVIEFTGREKVDKLLILDSNIQKISNSKRDKNLDIYFQLDKIGQAAFGFEGFRGNCNFFSGCTVFPYMSPDNNSDLACFITKFFLPNSNAIKNKHMDFDEIIKKLEEEFIKH